MSAPHFTDQCNFSSSSSMPEDTGEAPMLAFTFVNEARPIAIGSSPFSRCLIFAGIISRPAAISSLICSAVKCGSRSATRFISFVTTPRRANSNWVTAVSSVVPTLPGSGIKSHAVFVETGGIPGVSGELNVVGPPTFASKAKLPGAVPCSCEDGLAAPRIGNLCSRSPTFVWVSFILAIVP